MILFSCYTAALSQETEELYASLETDDMLVLESTFTTSEIDAGFEKKYHTLVGQAYQKLILEAEHAEQKLKTQLEAYAYENEKFNRDGSIAYQNKTSLIYKKYKAHTAMLSGLKSWNIFSEDRTGDLFYFMAENEKRIFKMYLGNLSEPKMVNFLIYKLADLYHFENNE